MILYALQGADAPGRIRYIGITKDTSQRLRSHLSSSTAVGAWARALREAGGDVKLVTLGVASSSTARAVEEEAITRYQIRGECDLNAPRFLRRVQLGEIVVSGRRARFLRRRITSYLEAA